MVQPAAHPRAPRQQVPQRVRRLPHLVTERERQGAVAHPAYGVPPVDVIVPHGIGIARYQLPLERREAIAAVSARALGMAGEQDARLEVATAMQYGVVAVAVVAPPGGRRRRMQRGGGRQRAETETGLVSETRFRFQDRKRKTIPHVRTRLSGICVACFSTVTSTDAAVMLQWLVCFQEMHCTKESRLI